MYTYVTTERKKERKKEINRTSHYVSSSNSLGVVRTKSGNSYRSPNASYAYDKSFAHDTIPLAITAARAVSSSSAPSHIALSAIQHSTRPPYALAVSQNSSRRLANASRVSNAPPEARASYGRSGNRHADDVAPDDAVAGSGARAVDDAHPMAARARACDGDD